MIKRSVFRLCLIACLTHLGCSVLQAQNSTLKQCAETIVKARQAVNKNTSTNQIGFALPDESNQQSRKHNQDWGNCVKGQQVPALSFKTLTGESYNTTSLAGKILVINFWFMGCAPCRAEMPALNRLVEEYKGKNVLFLGFTIDKAVTLKPAFFQQHRFDFKIIPDAQKIANSFYTLVYPTTYIVDQQGVIREAWVGVSRTNPLEPYHKAKAVIDHLIK